MIHSRYITLIIITAAILLFAPVIKVFFSGDDWFVLKVSQISTPQEFIHFFSFSKTDLSIPFYRPISSQLFFFIFQSIFGVNAVPFRIFGLGLFAVSLYLVYKFSQILFVDKVKQNLVLFFYSFSAAHFNAIYYLSAIQELFMITFVLFSLVFYFKKKIIISLVFFILALGSKETAVVTPILIVLTSFYLNKKELKAVLLYLPILFIYLILQVINYSPHVENSYIFDFSIFKFVNTLFWYIAWSFGVPELLVDYIGHGFKILPRFYLDFPIWSKVILIESLLMGALFLGFVVLQIRKLSKEIFFGGLFFMICLLPVIFFPWHKFAYYLTLPLIGFSISLASISWIKNKYLVGVFLITFLILNISSVILTYRTNYSVSRGEISISVFNFINANYPTAPEGSYFEFINDTRDYGKDWGSSKQIATAISNSNMFKFIYNKKEYEVFYEDFSEIKRPAGQKIEISSQQFLK